MAIHTIQKVMAASTVARYTLCGSLARSISSVVPTTKCWRLTTKRSTATLMTTSSPSSFRQSLFSHQTGSPLQTTSTASSGAAAFPSSYASTQIAGMATWTKVRPKRIRVITMDVTGTIVSFRGSLKDHYLGAAAKCGIDVDISSKEINKAFKRAYDETSKLYPCFGGDILSAKQWWKECVLLSFHYCGIKMTQKQKDQVFQRIYSTFGSNAAYKAFDDAIPFLRWAHRNGIICGVLSNADERYGDSILPMLGFTHDELHFQVFSKDVMTEKPDSPIFVAAIQQGQSFFPPGAPQCLPSEVLHIGNDFRKDFEGARRMGIHSVLLERYGEGELADEWKRRGAPVLMDLMDVIEFLGRSNCTLG